VLPHRRRFAAAYTLARLVRGVLPREIRAKMPQKEASPQNWPPARHARRVILLEGCVQPTLTPAVNVAAAHVLDRIGISVVRVPAAGCCGAVAHHLSAQEETDQQLKRNIDALWPHVESGVEAIIMTASACTAMLTDYGHLLREDSSYARRAARVSELAREMSDVLLANSVPLQEALRAGGSAQPGPKVAFQSPCTLQHALKIRGAVESLLGEAGFVLTQVPDSHLCCGSAGTYSLLQPELSARLLSNKVAALEQGDPTIIATANIGCQTHLRTGTSLPVLHWIQLLEARLAGRPIQDPRRI